jgi:hypothetical protein
LRVRATRDRRAPLARAMRVIGRVIRAGLRGRGEQGRCPDEVPVRAVGRNTEEAVEDVVRIRVEFRRLRARIPVPHHQQIDAVAGTSNNRRRVKLRRRGEVGQGKGSVGGQRVEIELRVAGQRLSGGILPRSERESQPRPVEDRHPNDEGPPGKRHPPRVAGVLQNAIRPDLGTLPARNLDDILVDDVARGAQEPDRNAIGIPRGFRHPRPHFIIGQGRERP